jgi:hypothetical protein
MIEYSSCAYILMRQPVPIISTARMGLHANIGPAEKICFISPSYTDRKSRFDQTCTITSTVSQVHSAVYIRYAEHTVCAYTLRFDAHMWAAGLRPDAHFGNSCIVGACAPRETREGSDRTEGRFAPGHQLLPIRLAF